MPQMATPKELFVHELQDMYYAEKTLVKALPQLAREATDKDLAKAFNSHLSETHGHVQNLEAVFKRLGKSAQGQPCPGIEGIKAEHDQFISDEDPTAAIRDLFLTGAASRAEHYEIAAYTGLVGQAKALGERECATLLETNLREEKDALKKVETIAKRLVKGSAPEKKAARKPSTRKSSTTRAKARA
jgi:ferritin-like metal-binding protein YciE